MPRYNFGRNVRLAPEVSYTPESEREVMEILARHRGQRIRCVGRLHSWSRVVESDGVLLDLRHLDQVVPETDQDTPSVVVGAGCQIKRLLAQLHQAHGWTLPSVGFIAEQTIAGAISTGTHGSGRHSLSHYVSALRIARYDVNTGESVIEEISSGDALRAARCSLGCFGVILSVRMCCRSAYVVEEHFREYDRLQEVLSAEAEYPQQQFYLAPWRWTYFAQHRRETDQATSKSASLYHWYRFLTFDIAMHVLILLAVRLFRSDAAVRATFRKVVPTFVIRDWRVAGPSSAQLVMEHQLFRHVEIELFVEKASLEPAMSFLKEVLSIAGDPGAHADQQRLRGAVPEAFSGDMKRLIGSYCHHYPICVRMIHPDDALISMASRGCQPPERDGAGERRVTEKEEPWYSITLTNYQRGREREPFEQLAGFLARSMAVLYGARPHWGKLCPLSPTELKGLYPEFQKFQDMRRHFDPDSVFGNHWTQGLFDNEVKAQETLPPGTA